MPKRGERDGDDLIELLEKSRYEHLLREIDAHVLVRAQAIVKSREASREITRLALEARQAGAPQAAVAERVKRPDAEGKLRPISRQALRRGISAYERSLDGQGADGERVVGVNVEALM